VLPLPCPELRRPSIQSGFAHLPIASPLIA
jgi:hypothetical protein